MVTDDSTGKPTPAFLLSKPVRASINLRAEIAEAKVFAAGLRESASVCSRTQGPLRLRLILAADKLDQLATLAERAVERVEELESKAGAS